MGTVNINLNNIVKEVQAGNNISVDNADPLRPIVSSTGGGGSEIDPVFAAWLGGMPDLSEFNNDVGFIAGYTLPTASDSVLGGIKVGSRLSIDGNGFLSADLQTPDLSGYLFLAGRAGGQTASGGTVQGESLILGAFSVPA